MENRIKQNKLGMLQKESMIYGRVPPQAPELEDAVLGAIMLERDAFAEVYPIIPTADVFYKEASQKIYTAIIEIIRKGDVVDLLTVTEYLSSSGNLELVGGAHYLMTLTNSVVSSAHIKQHAAIVIEKYMLREVIKICGQGVGDGYEDADPFDLLENLTRSLHEIHDIISIGNTVHISKVGKECIAQVDKIINNEIPQGGITSRIKSIDAVTGGWQGTDLIILAARPAVGKTAFALNMLVNADVPCLIFSLEMGKQQLYKRIVANTANIPLDFIMRPERMYEDVRKRWHEEYDRVSKMPIYINDRARNLMEISSEAKKYKRKFNIQFIVIDYLQLILALAKKGGNREQEVAYITRELKALAKELEVPIIALSQLNRAAETGKPNLSNLRESGAIEQDADVVMFLYAPDATQPENIILDFAKHRNGATGEVALRFEKPYQRFKDDEPEPFAGTKHFEPPDNPSAGINRIDFKSRQAGENEDDMPF